MNKPVKNQTARPKTPLTLTESKAKGQKAVLPKATANHDIYVSNAILENFDGISHFFRNQRFLDEFATVDQVAKQAKARYLRIGRSVLFGGFFALTGVLIELLAPATGIKLSEKLTFAIELIALLTFGIWVFDRSVFKSKARYLTSCFLRERLRQWLYQIFLDGELVTKDAMAQRDQIDARFDQFIQNHMDSQGAMNDFVSRPASSERMLHAVTPIDDQGRAKEVFAALRTIRFEHQSQFSRSKTSEIVSDQGLTLRENYHWSESLARTSLLAAIVIPAVQLLLLGISHFNSGMDVELAHIALSAAALFFVIVSASSRAYRTGLTLPEEIESYEDYTAHIEMLRTKFESASNAKKKDLLLELELEAERELKRFLIMKSKSTFLA